MNPSLSHHPIVALVGRAVVLTTTKRSGWYPQLLLPHPHNDNDNNSNVIASLRFCSTKDGSEIINKRCIKSKRLFSSTPSSSSPLAAEKTDNLQVVEDITTTTTTNNTKRHGTHDENTSSAWPPINVVFYQAPMSEMISRLKIISITTCVLSIGIVPALIALKQGSLPNVSQTAMGSVALLGAVGSTAALDFVFGPYVLTLQRIQGVPPLPTTSTQVENSAKSGDEKEKDQDLVLQATTRSVFGWKKRYNIYPLIDDIEPYQGIRPFANLVVNNVSLYIHPERLDPAIRNMLLPKADVQQQDNQDSNQQQNPQQQHSLSVDREGLKSTNGKKDPKDDDFW